MTPPDVEDRVYTAAYLDGEGCFFVKHGRQAAVACETTHRPTIEWLQRTWGGSVSHITTKKKANWRPTHRWCVVSSAALHLCQWIAPYLKEKKEQALLLIHFQLISPTRGNRPSAEVAEEKTRLASRVKGLKRVAS